MADFIDSNGQIFKLGTISLQNLVENQLGNDAVYQPVTGAPVALRGIKKTRREFPEDLSEVVGRIDTDHRFKVQRNGRSVADFPPDPTGNTFGQLVVAGQTHSVFGVAYERTTHISLFLSDPIT